MAEQYAGGRLAAVTGITPTKLFFLRNGGKPAVLTISGEYFRKNRAACYGPRAMRGIFLSSLSIPVLAAFAAGAAVTDTDACRSARDAALARIAAEEAAMRSMLDADAAILDAPSYYLSEAEKTLLADIEADRTRAAAAYHACLKANAVRRQSR